MGCKNSPSTPQTAHHNPLPIHYPAWITVDMARTKTRGSGEAAVHLWPSIRVILPSAKSVIHRLCARHKHQGLTHHRTIKCRQSKWREIGTFSPQPNPALSVQTYLAPSFFIIKNLLMAKRSGLVVIIMIRVAAWAIVA